MAGGKKQASGGQQSTLERFQGIIRRVVSKDDERSSLVDDIACVVGAEILEGLRRPGSDLNSVELARRFRTSRTPTREAVVILEKEGLVEILPRRRPRVADLSISEIREIYRVRAAMLGLIAAEVARIATDEEIAELRVLLREMERTAGASDRDGYYWGNVAFHERFADLARNKTLSASWKASRCAACGCAASRCRARGGCSARSPIMRASSARSRTATASLPPR